MTTSTFGRMIAAGAALVAAPAFAGHEPVDPSGPIFVPPQYQQGGAMDLDPAPGTGAGPVFVAPTGAVLSGAASILTTDRIVSEISAAAQFCGSLAETSYLVDCLGERLEVIGEALPDGDYAEARKAIAAAGKKLEALARANRDPEQPRGRAVSTGPDRQATSRPLTPVRPAAQAAVNRQALAILEEAETVLLRSAENSTRRMAHYQRISEAIGSNKVLLRSA